MGRIRNSGIHIRVTVWFIIILIALMLSVGIIVEFVCEDFIKKQRTDYNTKAISMMNYETERLYLQMNQLLNSLKDIPAYTGNSKSSEDLSTYEQIRLDLQFENSVKNVVYTNNFEQYIDGILFYYGTEDYYYIGNSSYSSYYEFNEKQFIEYYPDRLSPYFLQGPVRIEEMNSYKRVLRFVIQTKPNDYRLLKSGVETLNPFIMIEIDMEKITGMLSRMLSSDTGYVLMDPTGESLYFRDGKSVDIERIIPIIKERILKNKSYKLDSFAEQNILVNNIWLERFNWILSVADSQDVLYGDISSLMIKVECMIGLCGIIGIFISMLVSKRLLFPIRLLKSIVAEMSDGKEPVIAEENNEVTYVISMLKNMKRLIQELHEKQLLLEVKEQEARLEMLQAQINPHFLHNTLDNIYCIAQIEEIDPIVSLTKNLSNMMRYSLNGQRMFVELKKELEHVKSYIDIINIRFEDAIHLHIDVREELLHTEVIKLMLQPLVENSCVHGIFRKSEGKGNVWIRAEEKKTDMFIYVEDDGIGLSEENADRINHMLREEVKNIRTPKNEGFGIALINVNDRIRLIDGNNYGITIENIESGGCRVIIKQKKKNSI